MHEFILPAMDTQWNGLLDSRGGPIVPRVYDDDLLDRYVPNLAALPPRRFVQLNVDDEPQFTPSVLWLDAFGNEIDPPATTPEPNKTTPPRPTRHSPHWSPGSTDTASTATDTTGVDTSPSTSSSAFTLHDDSTFTDK